MLLRCCHACRLQMRRPLHVRLDDGVIRPHFCFWRHPSLFCFPPHRKWANRSTFERFWPWSVGRLYNVFDSMKMKWKKMTMAEQWLGPGPVAANYAVGEKWRSQRHGRGFRRHPTATFHLIYRRLHLGSPSTAPHSEARTELPSFPTWHLFFIIFSLSLSHFLSHPFKYISRQKSRSTYCWPLVHKQGIYRNCKWNLTFLKIIFRKFFDGLRATLHGNTSKFSCCYSS